jgi:predicted metal-dependent phosphoesterase TrpH
MKNKIIALIITVLVLFGGYKFAYPYLPHDVEYKKELLKSSGNPEYTLKNMKPIMGENELTYVIKKYDKHPEKYMTDLEEKGDQKGVENLTYRAGLHSHTTFSDGSLTPEETLYQAAEYADRVKAKHPFEQYPMIIAITDHFNTKGCVEAIDILQKHPEKFKNVRFVIGMETSVKVKMPSQAEERDLHVLAWCINPYEWPFKDLVFVNWGEVGEGYDNLVYLPDYKDFVKRINSLKYGITSIAHPLRYFDKDDTTDKVIEELFEEYKGLKTTKPLFTEGYYQPYRFDVDADLYNRTAEKAKEKGIYRTGSQDTHGRSIFSN